MGDGFGGNWKKIGQKKQYVKNTWAGLLARRPGNVIFYRYYIYSNNDGR